MCGLHVSGFGTSGSEDPEPAFPDVLCVILVPSNLGEPAFSKWWCLAPSVH